MASFTLGEILKAVSGVLLQQGSHEYCTGVNTDTRTISPGELFIALQGNTFDGHHFLNDACINGASMVIISERSSFKAVPRTVSVITDFLQQGMHISDLCIAVCRKGQEITVITLFHAKRDMNI